MAKIEELAKEWYIRSWDVPPTDPPGPIPSNGFKVGGPLRIAIEATPVGGTPACALAWQNTAGEPCSITGLPFRDGRLQGLSFPVKFGSRGEIIVYEVEIRRDAGGLHGFLASGGGSDGNTGTFAADANPPAPLE
jgi:hypothetical protein